MIKPFLTYQQQIQKLTTEKHLIIKDTAFVMEKIQNLGYFTLIGGYKEPFRDPMTRVYVGDTTFEDIYELYQFDNQLRDLMFRYLLPKEDFRIFIRVFSKQIKQYLSRSQRIDEKQLLAAMGFPVNWKAITRYKI